MRLDTSTELDAVRVRRAELRSSLNFLELCLAAPASGREVVWGETVHDALVNLAGDFGAHVEVTEGPGGLHQAILGAAVRLTNAVTELTAEHVQIATEIAELVADSAAPVIPSDVGELRDRTTRLLGHLVRHRQRGADLIYEAYQTDIGGGD
jgi:hypothetical protein